MSLNFPFLTCRIQLTRPMSGAKALSKMLSRPEQPGRHDVMPRVVRRRHALIVVHRKQHVSQQLHH